MTAVVEFEEHGYCVANNSYLGSSRLIGHFNFVYVFIDFYINFEAMLIVTLITGYVSDLRYLQFWNC